MTSRRETAEQFFEACEAGKGWQACEAYCHSDAGFAAQAAALQGVDTLQAYTDWMQGLMVLAPDGRAEVKAFALDEGRGHVVVYGVFRGTHTGEGGPVPPTGKSVESDYVYDLAFDGD